MNLLEQSGFSEDKLNKVRDFMGYERCDLLDVLEFLAYNTTPIDREKRADIVRKTTMKRLSDEQKAFVDFILSKYIQFGFKELGNDKLPDLVQMKYHSMSDAITKLSMKPHDLRRLFLSMQHDMYTLG